MKKVKNNKQANKVAEEVGYDGAEELKEDYVDRDGAKFNMHILMKTDSFNSTIFYVYGIGLISQEENNNRYHVQSGTNSE